MQKFPCIRKAALGNIQGTEVSRIGFVINRDNCLIEQFCLRELLTKRSRFFSLDLKSTEIRLFKVLKPFQL